jgi:dTDP-4-amino-4,6-dideoxygalactose transaminase
MIGPHDSDPAVVEPVPRRILALPTLAPGLVFSPPGRLAFPLSDPRTELFYLGRGAVWHAAKRLGLAGTEVLVPAWHHGVEVEALLNAGVHPRFYGVKRSFAIDLENLERSITPDTRAIYVIHYAGFPQPMDAILGIARTRGLKVIEDCALALFSSHGRTPLGIRADASVFCLYKTLPLPHGGALWMRDDWERATLRPPGPWTTTHQLTSSLLTHLDRRGSLLGAPLRRATRNLARAVRAVHELPVDSRPVGNRRFVPGQERMGMSPLVRSLALQLDAERIVDRRRRNFYALLGRLRSVSPPLVQELAPGVSPLFYPLWCPRKRRVQELLAAANVETIDFWSAGSPLVRRGEFPEVDALRDHVLELPLHQDLETEDLESMARAVRQALLASTEKASRRTA